MESVKKDLSAEIVSFVATDIHKACPRCTIRRTIQSQLMNVPPALHDTETTIIDSFRFALKQQSY
jgi:hypothetical protein